MKFISLLLNVSILSSNLLAMSDGQRIALAPLKQQAQVLRENLWAQPEDLVHGIYLAAVNNYRRVPLRISEIDFKLTNTDEVLELKIADENKINPLVAMTTHNFTSNELELQCQFDQQDEVACLKVEHLLHPSIYRLLTIVRTFNGNECDVETYIDRGEKTPHHTSQFKRHNSLAKAVTRVYVTVNDEHLDDLNVHTSSFSCR